jgi:hypothetical protein
MPYTFSNGITVDYAEFNDNGMSEHDYFIVKFSEPVTFSEFNFIDYDNGDDYPSIKIYYMDNTTPKVQTIDVTSSNDFPENILWISIIQRSSSDKYKFKGMEPSPMSRDTVIQHDTVIEYDTIKTTDTLTYFVDTCNGTTNIDRHDVTDYDVFIDGSDNLIISNGIVDMITIYSVNGRQTEVAQNTNSMYVGDLRSGTYIALIEVEGDKITYRFTIP